jgi:hypothetical protein
VNTVIKDFVDVGDPGAPIGSVAWCRAAHVQLCATKRQTDSKVRHLKYDLLAFKKEERWKQLTHGKGEHFLEWKEYVETPEPDGLGIPIESVQTILEIVKDDALIGEVLNLRPKEGRPPKGEEKGSNRTIKRGENSEYWLARLKRDHPEIREAYDKGEYPSVRAAAIEAGIVKIKSPLEQLYHWWDKTNNEDRETFKKDVLLTSTDLR